MTIILFTIIMAAMLGYGIYAGISNLFIAGIVGFIATQLNQATESRPLKHISYVIVYAALIAGACIFYAHRFIQ